MTVDGRKIRIKIEHAIYTAQREDEKINKRFKGEFVFYKCVSCEFLFSIIYFSRYLFSFGFKIWFIRKRRRWADKLDSKFAVRFFSSLFVFYWLSPRDLHIILTRRTFGRDILFRKTERWRPRFRRIVHIVYVRHNNIRPYGTTRIITGRVRSTGATVAAQPAEILRKINGI